MGEPSTLTRVTGQKAPPPDWADYSEKARSAAQDEAWQRRSQKPGRFIVYAVPHGATPLAEIERDPRWFMWDAPIQPQGSTQRFDIYEREVKVLVGDVLATGPGVWLKVAEQEELHPINVKLDHVLHGIYRPWQQFQNGGHVLIFLTALDSGYVWYYDSRLDALKSTTQGDWLDTVAFGAFATAAKSASWVLPAWKAFCYFAVELVPGGKYAKWGVKAASLAVFWDNHSKEIDDCFATITKIVDALKAINGRCPKLLTAMLAIAFNQSIANIQKAAAKDGMVKLITSNLDLKRWTRDIGTLAGVLLRTSLTRHSTSGLLAKGLSKAGLKRLSKTASQIHKTLKILRASARVTRFGGIKDKQVLYAKFLRIFSDAGVKLSSQESAEIIDEGLRDNAVLANLEKLNNNCIRLEKLVAKLTQAAEDELA